MLRVLGIIHTPEFDVLETATRRPEPGESKEVLVARDLNTAIHRFGRNITRARNRWAIEWYEQKMETAKNRLNDCRKAEDTVTPANDGNNGQTQPT